MVARYANGVKLVLRETEGNPFFIEQVLKHLTEAGREAFLAWVQAPVQHGRSLRLEFLVKLYFARLEGTAVAEQLLTHQRTLCHEWLATEQEIPHSVAVEIAEYVEWVSAGRFRAVHGGGV